MIFPTLRGKNGGYINLDECAAKYPLVKGYLDYPNKSPFLDPIICGGMVESTHYVLGIDYSFGGWLEERSRVWRGSYLDAGLKFIHLGYDFNAPVGTSVAVDRKCEIVLIDNDTPEMHGWGTRVIFRLSNESIYLMYAHIQLRLSLSLQKGSVLHPGTVFAEIAPSDSNGYWYPHVHVQAMSERAFALFEEDSKSLDGYGKSSELYKLSRLYPDPMRFIEIK